MLNRILKERFDEAQQIAQLGFWEWDIIQNRLKWSEEIYALFGLEKKNPLLSYESFLGFVHPEDRKSVTEAVDKALNGGETYDIRHRIVTADNALKVLRERGRVMFDEFERPIYMLGTVQDVSETVAKEKRLQKALDDARMFRTILDKSNDAIYITDPKSGRFFDFNDRAMSMLGYIRKELLACNVTDIEQKFDDIGAWIAHVKKLQKDQTVIAEGVHRRKDGSTFPIEASVSIFTNHESYIVSIIRDITERKRAEEKIKRNQFELEELVEERTRELEEVNRKLESYIRVVDNHVLTSSTDAKGVITYVSDAFSKATGFTRQELLGKRHNIVRHPDMPDSVFKTMWQTITAGKVWQGELKNRCKDGSELWVSTLIEPVFDATGTISGYMAIRHDIGDKKRIEELSVTDPLTGVYNRRFFYEMMEKALRRSARYGSRLCFAMIDIDNFKSYNDTYGHQAGDKALVDVSNTIQSRLRRADDYLFRLGGEEFGILCNCKNSSDIKEYSEGIRRDVEVLHIKHGEGFVTISMGISLIVPDKNTTVDMIVEKADKALYEAKAQGRNRVVIV